MDVVKEIMAAIKQYETIIIHRHQIRSRCNWLTGWVSRTLKSELS